MKKFVKSFNEKGYGYVLTVEEENGWYYPTIDFGDGYISKPNIKGRDISWLRMFARFHDIELDFLSEFKEYKIDYALKFFNKHINVEEELKDFYIEMY